MNKRWIIAVVALLMGCEAAEPPVGIQADSYSQWASYAGTTDSAQFSSLTQINKENVNKLEVAWTFASGPTAHRCSPLVIGDVIYLVANEGVAAVNAETGEQIWHAPDTAAQYVRGLVFWQDDEGDVLAKTLLKNSQLSNM